MPTPTPEMVKDRIRKLVQDGKPIEAIRHIRWLTGIGYLDARQCLIDHYGWEPRTDSSIIRRVLALRRS